MKTIGVGREEGRHTEIEAIVATWNATALGERDLWSEFLRIMSGMSDMIARMKGGLGNVKSVDVGKAPGRRNIKRECAPCGRWGEMYKGGTVNKGLIGSGPFLTFFVSSLLFFCGNFQYMVTEKRNSFQCRTAFPVRVYICSGICSEHHRHNCNIGYITSRRPGQAPN